MSSWEVDPTRVRPISRVVQVTCSKFPLYSQQVSTHAIWTSRNNILPRRCFSKFVDQRPVKLCPLEKMQTKFLFILAILVVYQGPNCIALPPIPLIIPCSTCVIRTNNNIVRYDHGRTCCPPKDPFHLFGYIVLGGSKLLVNSISLFTGNVFLGDRWMSQRRRTSDTLLRCGYL